MDKKDLFRIEDDELISQIAKDYPALTDKESERIFSRINKKLGEDQKAEKYHEAVSGVERYHRPVWQRILGIAAGIAAVTGIAGSAVLLNKSAPKPVIVNDTVCSTSPSDTLPAAKFLTDSFLEAASLINGQTAPEHSGKRVVFLRDESETDSSGPVYSPVTDTSFVVPADITGLLEDIVTEEYMAELRDNGGDYFSDSIDLISGVVKENEYPSYIEFCGELYTIVNDGEAPSYTEEPTLMNTGQTSFTVRRSDGAPLYFTIVWDGAQWRIDNIERKSS